MKCGSDKLCFLEDKFCVYIRRFVVKHMKDISVQTFSIKSSRLRSLPSAVIVRKTWVCLFFGKMFQWSTQTHGGEDIEDSVLVLKWAYGYLAVRPVETGNIKTLVVFLLVFYDGFYVCRLVSTLTANVQQTDMPQIRITTQILLINFDTLSWLELAYSAFLAEKSKFIVQLTTLCRFQLLTCNFNAFDCPRENCALQVRKTRDDDLTRISWTNRNFTFQRKNHTPK